MMTGARHRLIAALAGIILSSASCTDESTAPQAATREEAGPHTPTLETLLTCRVTIAEAEFQCAPSTASAASTQRTNLIVGGQNQFVRLESAQPVIDGGLFSADVTIQNLTLQPFGTADGSVAEGAGVRVFFVDEPNNGVVVSNSDGTAPFLSSGPARYYEYNGALLGDDDILTPGEVSGAKTWVFALNGATEFVFSILIRTTVPDPRSSTVHLTRLEQGEHHGCAEGGDGKLYCWGRNQFGQLGNDTFDDRSTPVAVVAPAGVTLSNLVSGPNHSCAQGSDGNAYCWGWNFFGQLGNNTNTDYKTPVAVQQPTGVKLSTLRAGSVFTCALGDNGKVYCWGSNANGQLGDGTTTQRNLPAEVLAPAGVTFTNLAAGMRHTCASGSDGKTYCWGDNEYSQLGDGSTTHRLLPVVVAGTRQP